MNAFNIASIDEPSAHVDAEIKNLLREFNQSANPELWAKFDDPQHGPRPLCVTAHDPNGDLIGGLLATTSMAWLRIDIMAVREGYRRQGLGKQLLAAAEAQAARRGCQYSFLDTMDYQAPEFYRKCKYVVVGTIRDWDSHGHAKYFFTKTL